jgi:hypothetical protein
MFIIAAVAVIGALVLFLVSRSLASKVLEVAGTETTSVASLADLAASVGKEIGSGSFTEKAEVKGKARALEPLRADFSGTEAVWYQCVVTREWEEEYWESDKDGNRHRETRRGSETVSSVLREPPFEVEDGTGRILVDPRGAKVEPEKTWSSFEPGTGGAPLRVGSFALDVLAFAAGGRRTLGYRFEEKSIPVGRDLYILGEASDAAGSLRIRKPEKGRFIVSTRSEEEILKGAKSGVLWTRISAAVCGVGALVCLVIGLFQL